MIDKIADINGIEAEPTMTHLENMIQMADIIHDEFLILDASKPVHYFVDERTMKNQQGIPLVKPIAENGRFFWYICPYCQQIHIESKRNLFRDNPIIRSGCEYRNRVLQDIEIDMKKDPIADTTELAAEAVLEAEWEYMQQFEHSRKDIPDWEEPHEEP
jgi:hypothetical protein